MTSNSHQSEISLRAAYAKLMQEANGSSVEPAKLVAPMLERFMRNDRAFLKAKRSG